MAAGPESPTNKRSICSVSLYYVTQAWFCLATPPGFKKKTNKPENAPKSPEFFPKNFNQLLLPRGDFIWGEFGGFFGFYFFGGFGGGAVQTGKGAGSYQKGACPGRGQKKSTSSGASRSRYSTMARGSPRTILGAQRGVRTAQNGPKFIPKISQNSPQNGPKCPKIYPKTSQNSSQNQPEIVPKFTPKWPKIDLKTAHNSPQK